MQGLLHAVDWLCELFSFLTARVANVNVPEHNTVHITSGMFKYIHNYACIDALLPIDDQVISIGSERQIPNSDHEEADTHIMLHVNDSLERSSRKS